MGGSSFRKYVSVRLFILDIRQTGDVAVINATDICYILTEGILNHLTCSDATRSHIVCPREEATSRQELKSTTGGIQRAGDFFSRFLVQGFVVF